MLAAIIGNYGKYETGIRIFVWFFQKEIKSCTWSRLIYWDETRLIE